MLLDRHQFDDMQQLHLYQNKSGKVIFRVLPKGSYTDEDTVKVRRDLGEKLGDDTQLEVAFVDEIPKTRWGKHRFLVQELDIRYGE